MLCQEYTEDYSHNSPQRSLTITTSLDDMGRFPFHVVDLSSISFELSYYFGVNLSRMINIYNHNDYYPFLKEAVRSHLDLYRIEKKYDQLLNDCMPFPIPFTKNCYTHQIGVCDDKHFLITTPLGIIGKFDDVMICKNGDDLLMFSHKDDVLHEFIKHGKKTRHTITYKNKTKRCQLGIHSCPTRTDRFLNVMDYKTFILSHVSNFYNQKTNTDVKTKMKYDLIKKTKKTFINKNGLLIYYYDKDDGKGDISSRIISKCMITENSTGLRFRGTYNAKVINGEIVYKSLKKDDEEVYLKKNDKVIVNNITEKNDKRDKDIIGWKVVENEYGEKRIVKLMVMPDATIVRPVDEEFFHTKGKERCNKAIVMDIQYADEEKEESVVPGEMVAYSYLFNEGNRFEYKIGREVVPDTFDTSEDRSCTNGIHYYRNRKAVFDVYVNK